MIRCILLLFYLVTKARPGQSLSSISKLSIDFRCVCTTETRIDEQTGRIGGKCVSQWGQPLQNWCYVSANSNCADKTIARKAPGRFYSYMACQNNNPRNIAPVPQTVTTENERMRSYSFGGCNFAVGPINCSGRGGTIRSCVVGGTCTAQCDTRTTSVTCPCGAGTFYDNNNWIWCYGSSQSPVLYHPRVTVTDATIPATCPSAFFPVKCPQGDRVSTNCGNGKCSTTCSNGETTSINCKSCGGGGTELTDSGMRCTGGSGSTIFGK